MIFVIFYPFFVSTKIKWPLHKHIGYWLKWAFFTPYGCMHKHKMNCQLQKKFILAIVSLPFTINVANLRISSFVPSFKILSPYGACVVLLIGFGKTM